MSVILELADDNVHAMAGEILAEHHPELKMGDEYVRLCIFMASGGKDGSNVKLHGYDCYATISVIPYKERVDKRADAEITIDKDAWFDVLTEPQQRALLDHEITHLEIQTDDQGLVKTDDQGRPKLKLRLHDYQIGGFRQIAKRYGTDAIEVIEARKFDAEYGDDLLQKTELYSRV